MGGASPAASVTYPAEAEAQVILLTSELKFCSNMFTNSAVYICFAFSIEGSPQTPDA